MAGNFYGRQGYLNPAFVQVDSGNGEGTRSVLLGSPTDYRLKDVYELDLRVEKVIPLFAKADITLTADLFNVLNSSDHACSGRRDATPSCDGAGKNCTGNFGTIQEIQNAACRRGWAPASVSKRRLEVSVSARRGHSPAGRFSRKPGALRRSVKVEGLNARRLGRYNPRARSVRTFRFSAPAILVLLSLAAAGGNRLPSPGASAATAAPSASRPGPTSS